MSYERDQTWEEYDDRAYTAGIDGYAPSSELFENCVQNQWYSPEGGAVTGELEKDFTVVAGSPKYTGTRTIKVMFIANVAFSAGGSQVNLELTVGKNDTPRTLGRIPASTRLTGVQPVSKTAIFTLSTNDTLDFYFRTTDAGTPDITIEAANFTILKIG